MLDRLGTPGGVRVLLVLRQQHRRLGAARQPGASTGWRALDLLVVSDIFLSETAALADVVLPTAQWAEEEGTMTNLEGRVIRRRRALPPPPEVRTDLEMMAALAGRLGRGGCFNDRAARGLRRSCAGPARAGSPTTPASPTSASTPRTACSGRARTRPPRHAAAVRRRLPDRRTAGPGSSGSSTANPPRLPGRATTPTCSPPAGPCSTTRAATRPAGSKRAHRWRCPNPRAELHPDLARRLGIADSDLVELRSRRGAARTSGPGSATASARTPCSCRSTSAATGAQPLTDPALDRHSKMPAFKACAVAVSRAGGPDDGHLLTTAPPDRPTD